MDSQLRLRAVGARQLLDDEGCGASKSGEANMRWKQYAKDAVLIVFVPLFAIFIVALATHIVLLLYFSLHTRSFLVELSDLEREAYSHMSDEDVEDLLQTTWGKELAFWEYEPWLGFREKGRTSKFVNVNEFGIRSNSREQVEMTSLDGAVWFFGGSTTFGYGVSDSETIPAALEKRLNRPVINFGRGFYYSGQENLLFLRLLQSGYRPGLAIFLDGSNETCSINAYQDSTHAFFERAQIHYRWSVSEVFRPLLFVLEEVASFFDSREVSGKNPLSCESYGRVVSLREVARANLGTREQICSEYQVDCTTFVLGFSGVHGKYEDVDRLSQASRESLRKKFVHLEPVWEEFGATFLTDTLDDFPEHAFVDESHYSARANDRFSRAIHDSLRN